MLSKIRTTKMFTVSDFVECEAIILDYVRAAVFADIEQEIPLPIYWQNKTKDMIVDQFLQMIRFRMDNPC